METIYNNEDLNDYQESDVSSTENNGYIQLIQDDGSLESEYNYADNSRDSSYIRSPSIYNSQQMRNQLKLKTQENVNANLVKGKLNRKHRRNRPSPTSSAHSRINDHPTLTS